MTELSLTRRAITFFGRLKKGAILNLMVSVLGSLGLGFASYYFQTQGLAFYKIMLVWAIGPLVSLPVVFFVHAWSTRTFLRLGVLAFTGMSLSLLFYNPFSYILFGICGGLVLACFWVSFNYVFFLASAKSQHAKDSSVYFLLGPLIGMVMPSLGALLIDGFGFRVLFFVTSLLSLVPLLYVKGVYFDHTMDISFRQADKDFSGIRLIAFFDGVLHYFQGHFLTIYALLFLKTEYEVGGLLSYLALLSLFVSFVFSYISDRRNKRVEFLYPLLIAMAILILVMPSLHSLSALVIVIGVYAILDNLSLPIRFAVHMDMGTRDIGFWRASEFYGNIGRTVIFGLSALLLYVGNYWLPFIIFAFMSFAFPFIISYKLKRHPI